MIFQVKEIYNYTQDDLITEDVLLLDCQREIYVWVGLLSVVKSKQEALNLGLVSCLLLTESIVVKCFTKNASMYAKKSLFMSLTIIHKESSLVVMSLLFNIH